MNKQVKTLFVIIDIILLLILLVGIVYFSIGDKNGTSSLPVVDDIEDTDEPVVYLNGNPYREKTDLNTILLIGLDSTGEMKSNGRDENGIKSDFVTLLIIDGDAKEYTLLHLNRDTMTEVPRIGIGGASVGTSVMQLALAYTYGDGMDRSCKNTVDAVENLLYGIDIDHYFAINMDGFAKLIDCIGGVDVTIHGDFSNTSLELVDGALARLDGELCVSYLRARQNVGEETNIERAERQRSFIREVLPQISNQNEVSLMISDVAEYVVSDMNLSYLSAIARDIMEFDLAQLCTPEGEISEDGEFIEFYPDDADLRELVISLFYTPAEAQS